MAVERWILHADMDAFYASIEQRDNPELRGKPVIVGASSKRGVVAAASYEARKFGVRSAMPGFRARELCPQGVFLGPNMKRYAEVSRQVHDVFRQFTDTIEPIAFDEAFLDITGSVELFGGPLALACAVKEGVRERTELDVSVGVGPNKLVAKIACTSSKPNGLRWVQPGEIRALLDPLPVRRLWGVGPVLGKTLGELGIQTIGDVVRYGAQELTEQIGDRGYELWRLAQGMDDRPVDGTRDPKSYGEENTFPSDILDRSDVSAAVTGHAEAVARRLRRDGFRGRTITLKIKLGRAEGRRIARGAGEGEEPRYPLLTRSRTLAHATDDAVKIRAVALELWDAAQVTIPVRLLGVSLSNLEREDRQLELPFVDPVAARAAKLGPALDAIQERFGVGAIRRAIREPEKATHSLKQKHGDADTEAQDGRDDDSTEPPFE